MSYPRLLASFELYERPFEESRPELATEWVRIRILDTEEHPVRIVDMVLDGLLSYLNEQPDTAEVRNLQQYLAWVFSVVSNLRDQELGES